MENKEKMMNAGPLGLIGFGTATLLLNLHNVGLIGLDSAIVAMGIILGGLVQFIAGLLEFKNKNNFGGTAFVAFGAFWFTLVMIWRNDGTIINNADNVSMGFYLLVWAILGVFLFIGTFKHNLISRIIFGLLTLLFILLAIAEFTQISAFTFIAGIVGITNGLLALYNAAGQILHEEFGKKFLPLF